jgi:7-cyano-7-deazaguanine synthase
MVKKAIILFSGGLDSTTCLAIAKSQNYSCYALSFEYGQKHHVELERAKHLAKMFGVVEHKILRMPLDQIGGSSLTDDTLDIVDYQASSVIPNSYVPARNTLFLSFALAWAEVIEADTIFIGANSVDYSGYPDCRAEYFKAFEVLAKFATKTGVESQQSFIINTPLLFLSKAEIIKEGIKLGIDYSQTVSCYRADNDGRACGSCDSCVYRKKGFKDAQVEDQTRYVTCN